jgi:hypothetical protein
LRGKVDSLLEGLETDINEPRAPDLEDRDEGELF